MIHDDCPKTPDDVAVRGAIEVVARHILARAAEEVEWGDYPEIGETDWRRVICLMDEIANESPAEYDDAYLLLERRAVQ